MMIMTSCMMTIDDDMDNMGRLEGVRARRKWRKRGRRANFWRQQNRHHRHCRHLRRCHLHGCRHHQDRYHRHRYHHATTVGDV